MAFKKGDPKTKEAAKTGGHNRKGVPNKATTLDDDQRKALAQKAGGITPLEFACSVLRDPVAPMKEKQWACELLMPYMHRKLPVAVDMTTNTTVTTISAESLANMPMDQLDNLLNAIASITQQQQVSVPLRKE